MALSTSTTIYSGGAQTFVVNFALGFIQRSDVQVRVNGELDGLGDPAYRAFTWIDDASINVTATLTVGDSVQILRTVSKTELKVNFSAQTDVTPANLDLSAKHGLMVYQELVDGRVDGAESPKDAADRATDAATAALVSEGLADADATAAAASAAAALVSEGLADADRVATNADVVLTAADVVATAADLVATNQDTIDTAADSVATAADAIATAADLVQTNIDQLAVAADLVATNQDTIDTAADLVATNADAAATALDKIATNADVVLTAADVVLAEADKVQTGLDRIAVAADLVLTNQDTIDTAADLVQTALDAVATAADRVQTGSDVTASQAAKVAAEAALDSFDDVYLGAKASAPTLDNDGDALVTGALYFDTVADVMNVYEGATWVAAFASLSGSLIAANNLSDLSNAGTARTNLGVAIGSNVQAHSAVLDATTGTFLTADQTKLDGIATSANNYALPNATAGAVGGIRVGTNLSIDGLGVLSSTDTNTTYSVQDGELSEISFTTADNSKLDGIAASATANQSDAVLKDRANHTGTQLLSTISDAGTAAGKAFGTADGNLVEVQAGGALPALDGSALTGVGGGVGSILNTQNFTSSGTWTKPASGTWAVIQAWGGGSGGNRGSNSEAGGGGGGGYIRMTVPLATLGSTEGVTVGSGGSGTSASNGIGANGGMSIFDVVRAPGGVSEGGVPHGGIGGGQGGWTSSSFTGSASASIPTFSGGCGGSYHSAGQGAVYGGGGGGAAYTKPGGSSTYGGNGGAGGYQGTNGAGGSAPGGGGGASWSNTSGPGARGQVKVEVY